MSALGRVKETDDALQGSDDHCTNMRGFRVSTRLMAMKNLIEERTGEWASQARGAIHLGMYAGDNLPEGVKRVCGGENGVACGQLVKPRVTIMRALRISEKRETGTASGALSRI